MLKRLPALLRLVLALTAINWAVFAVLRGAFWAVFHDTLAAASWSDLLNALSIGLRFDLRLALDISLPLALLGWIPILNPARRASARAAWIGYFAATQCVVLFLYFVDFGHYRYIRVRLNTFLVDHLTPGGVAARVAWETSPMGGGVLALALLTDAYAWLASQVARRALAEAGQPADKWTRRGAVAVVAALYVLGIWGKWSWYPLRWSEAY